MPHRGDRDDVDVLTSRIQAPGDFETVRIREVHIEEDDVDRGAGRGEFVEAFDRVVSAQARCDDVETGHPRHEIRVRLRGHRVVFDDEDPQRGIIAHVSLLPPDPGSHPHRPW